VAWLARSKTAAVEGDGHMNSKRLDNKKRLHIETKINSDTKVNEW
jgi:hypothetical protein